MRLDQDRSGHLDETLDALCLSAENRKRAQAWMDCSQPEDAELAEKHTRIPDQGAAVDKQILCGAL